MASKEFEEARERVKNGDAPTVTVRELLAWFGAYRRGKHKAAEVRSELEAAGLRTWPDFTGVHIDGQVELRPLESSGPAAAPPEPAQPPPAKEQAQQGPQGAPAAPNVQGADATQDGREAEDPVPRLAQLAAANRAPVTVTRDASIEEAVTKMLAHGFSQLPVMQNERNLDGYISWRSIGLAQTRGETPRFVREAMDKNVHVLRADTHLFEAVQVISEHDFVLVEGVGKRITGIVTTADVSLRFLELARPFLLISQIEGHLRAIIDEAFEVADLEAAKDPGDASRKVESAADLSFGEYLRLFQSEGNWAKLNFKLDRKVFVSRLDAVRIVRNSVMHFDPEDEADDKQSSVALLLETSRFLDSIVRK